MKVIKIKRCGQCPYRRSSWNAEKRTDGYYFCTKAPTLSKEGKKLDVTLEQDIPVWCPLEELPRKTLELNEQYYEN